MSAIVPCFDVGPYLMEAVRSLLGQTEPPLEIVVVDDASTDPATLEALTESERLSSVRVIRLASNRGVAHARNVGMDAARGDAVVFLDGDDLFHREALETFAEALGGAPKAGFAYPTVTCFGNRSDTFEAPPFDEYILHQFNICPIAGMARRSVVAAGIRFDEGIVVGHEDWDFWLRVTAAGFLGVASPRSVMFYRRFGATRLDLGNRLEGGFDRQWRALRPELFAPARLARIKRTSCPALTILAVNEPAASRRQTTQDFEVLGFSDGHFARGKILLFAFCEVDSLLRDRSFVERVVALHETHPELLGTGFVRREALASSMPLCELLADHHLRLGYVDRADVCAFSCPLDAMPPGLLGEPARVAYSVLLEHVSSLTLLQARAFSWRAGPLASAMECFPADGSREDPANRGAESSWSRDFRLSLVAALPWRLVDGEALFPVKQRPSSSFRSLRAVLDRNSTRLLLYGPEETVPAGLTMAEGGCSVFIHEAKGTAPLLRVLDPRTERRSLVVGEASSEQRVEVILGFVETAPLPGTQPLLAEILQDEIARPGSTSMVGWVYPAELAEEAPGLDAPLLEERRWWRARSLSTGRHHYSFTRTAFAPCYEVEGSVLVVTMREPAGVPSLPLMLLLDRRSRLPVALTSPALLLQPTAAYVVTTPVGFVSAQARPGYRPIYLCHHAERDDFLCSNVESEGDDEGYRTLGLIGHARA